MSVIDNAIKYPKYIICDFRYKFTLLWASTTPDKQCRTQFISKIGSQFINRLEILLDKMNQVLWNWFKTLLNIAFELYQIHNLLEFWKDIYLMRCIVFEVVTKVNKKLRVVAGFFLSLVKKFKWTFRGHNFSEHVIAQIGFFQIESSTVWINTWVCLPHLFLKQNQIKILKYNYLGRWLRVQILHILIVTQFPTNYSFTVKIAQTHMYICLSCWQT